MPAFLEYIGFGVSLVGLAVTIYLAKTAKIIKDKYLLQIRLPDIFRDLSKLSEILLKDMSDWDKDRQKAYSTLAKLSGVIDHITSKQFVTHKIKKQVTHIRALMRPKRNWLQYKKITELEKDEVWEIYRGVLTVTELIDQQNKDTKSSLRQ